MKKTIKIGLALLLTNIYLKAQRPEIDFKPKIDSIQAIVNNSKINDTTLVKSLNDLARLCFFELEYKRGLIATKQAHLLSQKINYSIGEGLYLRTMFVFLRHYLENFDYRAKWFFNEHNIKETRGRFRIKPSFSLDRSQLETESKQLSEALIYFEKIDDSEFVNNITLAIVGNYVAKNEMDKALFYAEKGIKAAEKSGDDVQRFLFLIYKLFVFEQTKRIVDAKNLEIEVNLMITKTADYKEIAVMTQAMSQKYSAQNRRALTIDYHLKSIAALEKIGDKETVINLLRQLSNEYQNQGLPRKSADCFKKIIKLKRESNDLENMEFPYNLVAFRLIDLNELDSAKSYLEVAKSLSDKNKNLFGQAQYNDATGQLLMAQNEFNEAIPYLLKALDLFAQSKSENYFYYVNLNLAKCYQKTGKLNESIQFGLKCYNQALKLGDNQIVQNASLLLSEIYDQTGKPIEAYKYLKIYKELSLEKEKANVSNELADIQIKAIIQKGEEEKQTSEKEKQSQQNWIYFIATALFASLIILYVLFRNIWAKQKANELLKTTLSQLSATQNQLIQSEKLASLGELTAGIAHEIQNPLNFVNNFSEVSNELIQEIKDERQKPKENQDEELIDEIFGDISQNLEKITLHGKRASSIVKGMLDHSKASSGHKELTDINALADEYLRLTFHGLKAKDKTFTADFKTDFDPDLPKIEVIPQDFGRVLLNLITNAFYAVKMVEKPKVVVKTERMEEKIIIKISDNGTGMTDDVKAKIFQPFFTTKPTGEGTGLGLSLAYDIITKGHGGTIECESAEGEGTTFTIRL